MRVGLMVAAAAAALMCAGQAQAVTWVQYEIRGTGIETTSTAVSLLPVMRPVDFRVYVTVEVDPGTFSGQVPLGSLNYTSTGSTFNASYFYGLNQPGIGSLSVNGATSGHLTGTYSGDTAGANSDMLQFDLNYADTDMIGDLPRATASSIASGTLSYSTGARSYGQRITGAVTGLAVFLNAAPYATPTATAVPEPATWAMMLLGMGAIGAGARRRRRTLAAA